MPRPEAFRSLASTLLAARVPGPDEPAIEIAAEIAAAAAQTERHGNDTGACSDDELALMRDVRLFHARVMEAIEAAVETVAGDIAAAVLGRELLLAPAEIETIVDRALKQFAAEEPLLVRVHPEDAERLTCAVPVAADATLRPGDAVIDVRTGSIDASLGVRLAAVLASCLP